MMTPNAQKRSLSWEWFDAMMILIAFFYLPSVTLSTLARLPESFRSQWLTIKADDLPDDFFSSFKEKDHSEKNAKSLQSEHPLTILIVSASQIPRFSWVFALCFVTGVVTAPIVEEFVFRVVLQGTVARYCPSAFGVIGIPAILFALIHVRGASGIHDLTGLNTLLLGIVATSLAHLLIMIFAIIWLRTIRNARWSELGFVRQGMIRDFFLGVGCFFLIFPLLIVTQWTLGYFFPGLVTDPAPIFILAIGLGILFQWTHQFSSIFGMHATLNFVSFCGILLAMKMGQF